MEAVGRIVTAYQRWLQRLGHLPAFAWAGVRFITPVDKWLFARLGGRLATTGPVLVLTTVGRRSGALRPTPLLYAEDGEALVVVVGSNWGQRHHPDWSANLLAHPEASVVVGGQRRDVHARLASPQYKARLWPRLVSIWPAYQTYARRSGRDLRVFVLSPVRRSLEEAPARALDHVPLVRVSEASRILDTAANPRTARAARAPARSASAES
jgi:deazaflavin-dependent oxidoreductase (nitroreductase family)